LTASEDDGIVVGKSSPMAMTDSAITLDEELVGAIRAPRRLLGTTLGAP
jgi:hypothetical protein